MIVCLCRGISEREIAEAIRSGAGTVDDVGHRCGGAGRDCGSCRADIATQLVESRTPHAA